MNSDSVNFAKSLNVIVLRRFRERGEHAGVQISEVCRQLAQHLDDEKFKYDSALQLRFATTHILQWRYSKDGALTPNKDGNLVCKRTLVSRHCAPFNFDHEINASVACYEDFRYDEKGNQRLDHPYAMLGHDFEHQVVHPLKRIRRHSLLAINSLLGQINDIQYPRLNNDAFFAAASQSLKSKRSLRADQRRHPEGYLPCDSEPVRNYLRTQPFRPRQSPRDQPHFITSPDQPKQLQERLSYLERQPTEAILAELKILHLREQAIIEQHLESLTTTYLDCVTRFRIQLEMQFDRQLRGPMVLPLVRSAPSGMVVIYWYAFLEKPDGTVEPVEITFNSRDVKRTRFLGQLAEVQRILSLKHPSKRELADVEKFRGRLATGTHYPLESREFKTLFDNTQNFELLGDRVAGSLATEVAYAFRIDHIKRDFLPYTQPWECQLALYFANGHCAKYRNLILANADLRKGCSRPTPESVIYRPPNFDDILFES